MDRSIKLKNKVYFVIRHFNVLRRNKKNVLRLQISVYEAQFMHNCNTLQKEGKYINIPLMLDIP